MDIRHPEEYISSGIPHSHSAAGPLLVGCTLRSTYGTLMMDIIARHGGIPESENGSRKNPRDTGVVSYYDLEKDAWRCFKADSIQEIDHKYERC